MQKHSDPTIRAEAIECIQAVHLFAPKYVSLNLLVPYLVDSLVSRAFLLRRVSAACLRQLCQRESLEVCRIAKEFVQSTQPIGLVCLVGERGLEYLLFKMLDIETNPALIRDLHDILHSLLCTSLNEKTLKLGCFYAKILQLVLKVQDFFYYIATVQYIYTVLKKYISKYIKID